MTSLLNSVKANSCYLKPQKTSWEQTGFKDCDFYQNNALSWKIPSKVGIPPKIGHLPCPTRLCGPSGKVSASRAADLGSIPAFSLWLSLGRVIPVTWRLIFQWLLCQMLGIIGSALALVGPIYVSILWLGEKASLICNFYLSMPAGTIIWEEPSLSYTSMLLGR